MKKHKKVLLLGSEGFIGKAILDRMLHSECYKVTALQYKAPFLSSHHNLEISHGNIRSLQLDNLQPDIIVHAARIHTGRFGSFGQWVMSKKGELENRKLLIQIKNMKHPPHIIYCSGSLMYGSHKEVIIDESFPVQPVSFARQYVAAERPFLEELERGELPITILRLPWVIGRGSGLRWNYERWIIEKEIVPVYGNGDNMMTFVDVDVIGNAIAELVDVNFKGIFNLFHPQYLSQQQWVKIVADVCGVRFRKLSDHELNELTPTVREAFTTNIMLGSMHSAIQQKLLHLHEPLPLVVQKHLSVGKDE